MTMTKLYLDLETYSPIPIAYGVHRYAEKAEILLFAYAIDNGPVRVWDCSSSPSRPAPLQNALMSTDVRIIAHNSSFDRTILKHCGYGNYVTDPPRWEDTMVRALAHGLPGALGLLSEIFRLGDNAKIKEGRKLIHLFCKPNKDGKRNDRISHPEQWATFVKYATNDIAAMRELDRLLPKFNDTKAERELWLLDQKINDRGFEVDLELAQKAVELLKVSKRNRNRLTKELTNNKVQAATQRDAMLKFMLDTYGVTLPDLQKSTLTRRLNDPDLPKEIKELIKLRLDSSGTSTKKYQTLLNSASSDNRLRGTLQFCGASRTGRWSGRIFQPQNLPRPMYKKDRVASGIDAIHGGYADLLYGTDIDKLCSSAIRGAIVAPKGKKLVVSDLASIEGRVLAWLACESWKLKAYADYDAGQGHDMYVLTYAKTFGIEPDTVSDKQRQLGKTLELALGYGGGVGAFVTFAKAFNIDLKDIADNFTIDSINKIHHLKAQEYWGYCVKENRTLGLPEDVFVVCDTIKRLWRTANPNICNLWYTLESDFYSVANRDVIRVGDIDRVKSWVRMQLPSGRYVCYPGAKVVGGELKYLGINQYTRKWGLLSTYGGKLAENKTQAMARDVIAYNMQHIEAAGYELILSIHDEVITEAPDNDNFNAKHLSKLLARQHSWAPGLPLDAEGFEAYRYRKD